MDRYFDSIDWLGGYPYESATATEIIQHLTDKGFVSVKTFSTKPSVGLLGSGCGEYVFRENGDSA